MVEAMRTTTKFLLRRFLFTTLTFGGLGALPMAIAVVIMLQPVAERSWFVIIGSVAILLFVAFLYGAVMGAIVLLIWAGQMNAVRRQGYAVTAETLKPHQQRQFIIDLPFADTSTLCQAAVGRLKRASIVEEKTDYAAGVILARTGMSFWSFGEYIHFQLRSRSDGRTDVDIDWRPVIKTNAPDHGSSLGTLNTLIGFLVAHSVDLEEPSLDQKKTISDNVQTEMGEDKGERGIAGPVPIQRPRE